MPRISLDAWGILSHWSGLTILCSTSCQRTTQLGSTKQLCRCWERQAWHATASENDPGAFCFYPVVWVVFISFLLLCPCPPNQHAQWLAWHMFLGQAPPAPWWGSMHKGSEWIWDGAQAASQSSSAQATARKESHCSMTLSWNQELSRLKIHHDPSRSGNQGLAHISWGSFHIFI